MSLSLDWKVFMNPECGACSKVVVPSASTKTAQDTGKLLQLANKLYNNICLRGFQMQYELKSGCISCSSKKLLKTLKDSSVCWSVSFGKTANPRIYVLAHVSEKKKENLFDVWMAKLKQRLEEEDV